jgi:hypothetical protein
MPAYKMFDDRKEFANWMSENNCTYTARLSPEKVMGRPERKSWYVINGESDLPGGKSRIEVKRGTDSKRVYCCFDDTKLGTLGNSAQDKLINSVSVIVEPDKPAGEAVDLLRQAQVLNQTAAGNVSNIALAGQTMSAALKLSKEASDTMQAIAEDSAKAELFRQGGLALTLLINLLQQVIDKKLPVDDREGLSNYRRIRAVCNNQGIDIDDMGISDLVALDYMKKDEDLAPVLRELKKTIAGKIASNFARGSGNKESQNE